MCLIVVKKSGIQLPKEEHLENGAVSNRDGIGVAFYKKDSMKVFIKKDFANVFMLNKWIKENVSVEDSLIIHFRLGTSGLKDAGNAHPYPLVKDAKLLRTTELVWTNAVAHNGVFRDYDTDKILNDTQNFIINILSEDIIKFNLRNPVIQKLIKETIGGSKLAFMLENGEIIMLGEFQEEDGVNFSNSCYKWFNTKRIGFTNTYRSGDFYNKDWCEGCKSMQDDVKDIWHKKIMFTICRECRKKLAQGNLEDLFNEKKKSAELGCSVNDSKKSNNPTTAIVPKKEDRSVVFCSHCLTMVGREYANYESTDPVSRQIRWICDICKKATASQLLDKTGKIKCPLCEKNVVSPQDLVYYTGVNEKICIKCVVDLTKTGNVSIVAGSENGSLEMKKSDLN